MLGSPRPSTAGTSPVSSRSRSVSWTNALEVVFREAVELGGSKPREEARSRVHACLPGPIRGLRHQWLGIMSAGCTATHGLHERCDFSCTACYLPANAKRTPPLRFEEVRRQLDRIREHTGPAGSVQLTSGEVTLLPVDQLARIVRYAREIDLDPMVMTHGQTFVRRPEYLHALMRAGLEKVGVHVDVTQRGRPGQSKDATESELMQTRDRLASLIRQARRVTGRRLYAAHTVTVTRDNGADVASIVRWFVRNVDAFRLISFQPTADVGRTRVAAFDSADSVWAGVSKGAGIPLNRHTFVMGHPACSYVCLFFVIRFGDEVRIMEVKREHKDVDARFFDSLLSGAFRGFHIDDADGAELVGRFLGLFVRSPKYLWQWPSYVVYRALDGNLSWLPRFMRTVLTGGRWTIIPAAVVVHNFMSRAQLTMEQGEQRLASCAYRVPIADRMVSMCELNGTTLRERVNGALEGPFARLPIAATRRPSRLLRLHPDRREPGSG